MDGTVKIESITGVDVELRVAGPGGRSFAFIIDWHIRALGALAWLFLAGGIAAAGGLDQATLLYGVFLPAAGIYFLYHPVLEVLMKGQTPGKRTAGVRVLKADGGVPGIGALLIRNVFRLVDSLPAFYCIGLGATMLTRNSVRIGDLAAGTLLVYDDPGPDRLLNGLSGKAVERIGLEQVELVRDLLTRWQELDPNVRRDLARRLLAKSGAAAASEDDLELKRALEALVR